ncbi:AAA family ATPase [Microbacterium sp. ET2]|uniref:helix-turn-helix transcriptional regulator n=1 Tax=Microbacterium albipurpureum TaxID=3050384 RepID=UPI00259D1303|nr:AAA family ATPase [Microbacterium sp. ET2 (Ac-2212)]WJL96251.1 AAA family ATPase [Microbacterium sp. ET2 (Ac-2212)]
MPALASSPRMIGRDAELGTLLDALDDTRRGTPRSVIVRGEAGIGKTRLVQEFLVEATRRQDARLPVVVAVGQCVDLGPIGTPFGPVRRVLRDLHAVVGTDALREAAGSPAALATLAAFVPGVMTETSSADGPTGDFAEAIEVVLETLSTTRHLVIVIEDLQWADAATLALLKKLAGTLRGRHLTIVATYRSDDIDRFHPLRPVLAELDRTRAIIRVEVLPLNAGEVAEQVAILATADFGETELGALVERSGGIPFLVEELVDLGSAELPDTLRELVLARYSRLDDTAQEIVRVLAAGGMHTDHVTLAAVTGCDERTLDHAVRDAIAARVIVADGAGYTFRHALTQEAVHDEMLPSERVRVHRRYAEYLAADRTDSPEAVSAIAEHWLVARELTPAFDATVRALEQSRATFAPATSVKLAERLTELWHQVPDAATRSGTSLPELHLSAAQAWHDLGDPDRALRAALEGLSTEPQDPMVRAALIRQKIVQEFNTDRNPDHEELLGAIAMLEGIETDASRVLQSRILSNLALSYSDGRAEQYLQTAVALAEGAGDDVALAIALVNESWLSSDTAGDEIAALAPLERALELQVNPAVRAYVGAAYVDLLARLGRYDDAARVGEAHLADAVRGGIERGSGGSIAVQIAHAHFCAGRPDEAKQFATRARRLLDRPSRGSVIRLLAGHYAWNDQSDERDALLAVERTAMDESGRSQPHRNDWWDLQTVDAVLMSSCGLRATIDAEDRAAWAQRIDRIRRLVAREGASAARRFRTLTAAMLLRAVAPTRAGGEGWEELSGLRKAITDATREWPRAGVTPVIVEVIDATLADAAQRDTDERVRRWHAVVDAARTGVLPVRHQQIARLSLASALIDAGERDAAARELDGVNIDARRLGVARAAFWAEDLAERAGLRRRANESPRATDAVGSAALTPRERQVLALVAEGLTNAQIGARLYISPKTASVHVSAILAKVGASNRAEAAALFSARADVGRAS